MLGWIGKDIWVILISKLLGAKVVIHMRAGHFRRNYEQSNKVFKTIIKWVLNRTDYNLAQSPSLAKQYRGLVKDESKIDYVYNMIDSEKYFSNNSEYNQNKIFFLGHLSHAKGYCDILKVIPEVVREFPDTMFCFAGTMIVEERNVFFNEVDGTAINYTNPNMVYKNHIENKYDRNYMYLGKLNEKEKIEWLNKSNIFILPSYSEGFSMSVLEAIAMAKPIITTPVGALKDVLIPNENAVLVHPGDIEAIKDAILKILRDKSFRKQLADNNKILRKDFTVEVNSQKYKNLFKKLI
ncbi:glycosyltransferase family 4 protein [Winogradskyella ouciana]|nr:glycosyltransferase family 4 protein [Winogradskyella ouciana]